MQRSIGNITRIGLFVALLLLLGLTPIGNISFGTVNITLMAYPVIIGTLCFGLGDGLILGFFFGVINFVKTFVAPSALTAPLLFSSRHWYGPILYLAVMLLPRMMVPLTVHGMNQLKLPKAVRYNLASVAGSLTNTIFFLGMLYLFFLPDIARNYAIDPAAVRAMLLGIAASNGLVEAIVSIGCCPVVIALEKVKLHS